LFLHLFTFLNTNTATTHNNTWAYNTLLHQLLLQLLQHQLQELCQQAHLYTTEPDLVLQPETFLILFNIIISLKTFHFFIIHHHYHISQHHLYIHISLHHRLELET